MKFLRLIVNQKRLVVPAVYHRLNTSNCNWVKGLNGKVNKAIWIHGNPVSINFFTEYSAAPTYQVTHPSKMIRSGSALLPVLGPTTTVTTSYHAPKNPIQILDDIDSQLKGPN